MEKYLSNSKLNASTNLSRTPNRSIMSHLTEPVNYANNNQKAMTDNKTSHKTLKSINLS